MEQLQLNDAHVFVISDLHIAKGLETNGLYAGTENFFADAAFDRWIDYCIGKSRGEKAVLVINGDFIDFLRVIFQANEVEHLDYQGWITELAKVGIHKSVSELKAGIEKDESSFGFKTQDYKSIWKLWKVAQGHTLLFSALGKWLSSPHRSLFILKGNHDLEWHWKTVQGYFKTLMQEEIRRSFGFALANEAILFFEDQLIINQKFYIEHGHRYDNFAYVAGTPQLDAPLNDQLRLPFGSFFNRYLLNKVELNYPFLDNIRPTTNILPILLKEHFFLGIKLLANTLWRLPKFVRKNKWSYAFSALLTFILVIVIPLAIMLYCVYQDWVNSGVNATFLTKLGSLKNIGWMALSWLFGKLLAFFQIEEPNDLSVFAQQVFSNNPQLEIVTMGHTHTPYQMRWGKQQFYNTGTWIPIVETSTTAVRHDRTFTFLHVEVGQFNVFAHPLLRWNDDAGRADLLDITMKT